MRILHVIPHYYPAVRYGGPIRSVHGLASATAQLGHEVHVYTTNVDGPGHSDVPVGTPVARDGVNVWYFGTSIGRRVYRSPAMKRMLERTVSDFDIVHIHYVWAWPTIAAAASARRGRVPYVLAPRGMLVSDLIHRKSPIAKRIWLTLFDKRNVESAAAIHVTAESERADLLALGLRPRRIAVIENGTEFPSVIRGAPRASGSEPPFVLFLGRFSWKKGLDRLVSAMRLFTGADLVLAGYDEDGYQAKIERMAAEAGIANRVRFIGPVEGTEKWNLIRRARCLVLPSYHENFGMVVVEAMAVGCPVVVTEQVGVASWVRNSGSGLVVAGNPSDIAAAISTILKRPELAAAMGRAGMKAARERFSWDEIARRMCDLYQDCIGESRSTCAAIVSRN